MPNPPVHSVTTFETGYGTCSIAWSDCGIAGFQLPTRSEGDMRRWRTRRAPDARPGEPGAKVSEVIAAAIRYFAGEPVDFREVAVDLGAQSDFFARIYQALRQVPYGQTTTYGGLAKQLGAGPEMAREVGMAMAANPVPLIIPCHRVLAAGGQLGGFSAPGGSDSKLRMLELEGVRVVHQAAFDF
jgi:methylated-DNA-[protein]-cysteine S-methyltransferase